MSTRHGSVPEVDPDFPTASQEQERQASDRKGGDHLEREREGAQDRRERPRPGGLREDEPGHDREPDSRPRGRPSPAGG